MISIAIGLFVVFFCANDWRGQGVTNRPHLLLRFMEMLGHSESGGEDIQGPDFFRFPHFIILFFFLFFFPYFAIIICCGK